MSELSWFWFGVLVASALALAWDSRSEIRWWIVFWWHKARGHHV